jgi:hypothetical protein
MNSVIRYISELPSREHVVFVGIATLSSGIIFIMQIPDVSTDGTYTIDE